jgi:hypothetical protein
VSPALKGRAKIQPPLRGEFEELNFAGAADFLGKAVLMSEKRWIVCETNLFPRGRLQD